jgi:hypothetical protein
MVKGVHIGLVLASLASSATAVPLAFDNFNASSTKANGWAAINGAATITWSATGGEPAGPSPVQGYVFSSVTDNTKSWSFDAPSTYLGDLSAEIGGTLSFALQLGSAPGAPLALTSPVVKLLGNNGDSLSYLPSSWALPVSGSWTDESVLLSPSASWIDGVSGLAATSTDFQGVMGSLKNMRILGRYTVTGATALDNVRLTAAVPEPASCVLVALGLLALSLRTLRLRA